MKTIFKFGLFAMLLLIGFSCTHKLQEPAQIYEQDGEHSNLRMPFNQRLFLLNNDVVDGKKIGTLFELKYDFQGLGTALTDDQGNSIAEMTKLELTKDGQPWDLPRGGHMCISPKNDFITVVVSGKSTIYLVSLTDFSVREIKLFRYDPDGIDITTHYQNKFSGKITQVDVDRDGFLFLAGKSGFFRVIKDNGKGGSDDPTDNTGSDIWSDVDKSLENTVYDGEIWAHVIPYSYSGNIEMENKDDDEIDLPEAYFEDMAEVTELNGTELQGEVRFWGGDILFTQNSKETGGFEGQRLISFTQWGQRAIALELDWNWNKGHDATISYNAAEIFRLRTPHPTKQGKFKGTGRVTGAALCGDNMVFTSHHFKNKLQLWTLDGEVVDTPILYLDGQPWEGENKKGHNWGDMASTQEFDLGENEGEYGNFGEREINGDRTSDWKKDHWNLAEMKLYRPGTITKVHGATIDEANNPNMDTEARQNSANADIADLRSKAYKFTALGQGGYAVMRFRAPTVVTPSSRLQVVETTWNRKPNYNGDAVAALASYNEQAKVYVWLANDPYNQPRYVNNTWINEGMGGQWIEVGDAYISENIFDYSKTGIPNGTPIQWVKIVDAGSGTFDGFDINFVSAYAEYCEDFGFGDFESDNATFFANYTTYTEADRLDKQEHEGLASVTNNPYNVHNKFVDVDLNTQALVVNAAQNDHPNRSSYDENADLSKTFFKTYIPVLAGQTYYFSAEALNAIPISKNTNDPHLRMYIKSNIGFLNMETSYSDVVILHETDPSNVAWSHLNQEFTASQNGVIEIGIEEISDKWHGNDFVIDKISFSCDPSAQDICESTANKLTFESVPGHIRVKWSASLESEIKGFQFWVADITADATVSVKKGEEDLRKKPWSGAQFTEGRVVVAFGDGYRDGSGFYTPSQGNDGMNYIDLPMENPGVSGDRRIYSSSICDFWYTGGTNYSNSTIQQVPYNGQAL
ncbi:hypothetical protein [Flammeovirga pacifica]|uniref:Lipoprotein n=1 Tax=Flammeovirga pacifica TaxID=915059 RepID=A0A1S1YVU9_FLAPC|nr:hypothetical protein [Flammeovirga pacifica]OHX64983.1 hypothetical protein NH26_00775 [Flammeovirga pacifica]